MLFYDEFEVKYGHFAVGISTLKTISICWTLMWLINFSLATEIMKNLSSKWLLCKTLFYCKITSSLQLLEIGKIIQYYTMKTRQDPSVYFYSKCCLFI